MRDAVWCVAMEGVMRAWPCVRFGDGCVTRGARSDDPRHFKLTATTPVDIC